MGCIKSSIHYLLFLYYYNIIRIILIILLEKEYSYLLYIGNMGSTNVNINIDIEKTCTPLPIVINLNPPPWSRIQRVGQINGVNFNRCPPALYGVSAEELAMAEKIFILKNSQTRLTNNQIYSQVVQGLWTNPKKGYASQTDTYTEPNTNVLKRNNYSYLDVNSGQQSATKPDNGVIVPCIQPTPAKPQPKLPANTGTGSSGNNKHTLPPPPPIPSTTVSKSTMPKTLPVAPVQSLVIPVNGRLNCAVIESICS
jgi:hypothetical protein